MPSRARRREIDYRSDRFESEIRSTEANVKGRKFQCQKCGRMFEEKSRNCPRCDSRSMGEIVAVPERHLEEFRRNAMKKLGR